jgi:glutathione S-transferase
VLAAVETHLKERRFLPGERLTVADIGVYAYAHLAEEAVFPLAIRHSGAGSRWCKRPAAPAAGPPHPPEAIG